MPMDVNAVVMNHLIQNVQKVTEYFMKASQKQLELLSSIECRLIEIRDFEKALTQESTHEEKNVTA